MKSHLIICLSESLALAVANAVQGSDLMMAFSLYASSVFPFVVLQVLEATPTLSLFNILHKGHATFISS